MSKIVVDSVGSSVDIFLAMKRFYIYLHKRASDGVVFYVGKGRGKRASRTWGRNKHRQNVVAKHGCTVVIFKDNLSEEEAFNEEKGLITFFRDLGLRLTNMTDGGDGVSGLVHSLEARKKMSEVKKGENHPFYGKNHSRETRKKMSEANLKFHVIAKNIKTGEELVLKGTREIILAGFQHPSVYNCLNGKAKTHKGHTFTKIPV